LEEVNLGGIDQWILIRAQDPSKPVLLFLHGGPGASPMPWIDMFQPVELEENFVVVHWDQRGAGKSYDPALTLEDLRAEKLIGDTLELTNLLRERFGQEKIFLTGHSWGSALGFVTIQVDSSPFHAFIASSERVHWKRSHQIAFDWVKEQATEQHTAPVLEQIASMEPFDIDNETHVELVYKSLDLFGGGDIHAPGLWNEMLAYAMEGKSPYYTEDEVQTYIAGIQITQAAVEPFAVTYDLFQDYPRSDIPVHFLQGEYDYNTPEILSREYYEALEAPAKSYTVIEGAAHSMMYEKPHIWAEALIDIARATLAE
jgi:pimeloyl-ACP methyl ester carboxylesterase